MFFNLQQISYKFSQLSKKKLLGFEIQKKMSPPYRKILSFEEIMLKKAKESAVLILLYEKNEKPYIVVIERSAYEGIHSKQISLPGGKKDITDKNLKNTAKREAQEEIGIKFEDIEVIAELSYLYIPVSNFIVYPFVAVYNSIPNFIKEKKEVESIIEIPLDELLDRKNITSKTIKLKNVNLSIKAPTYSVQGVEIWGATAMILCEFLDVLERG